MSAVLDVLHELNAARAAGYNSLMLTVDVNDTVKNYAVSVPATEPATPADVKLHAGSTFQISANSTVTAQPFNTMTRSAVVARVNECQNGQYNALIKFIKRDGSIRHADAFNMRQSQGSLVYFQEYNDDDKVQLRSFDVNRVIEILVDA